MNRQLKSMLVPAIVVAVALLAGLAMFFIMDMRNQTAPVPVADQPEEPQTTPRKATPPEQPADTPPERPAQPTRSPDERVDPVNRLQDTTVWQPPKDFRRLLLEGYVKNEHGVAIENALVQFAGTHALRGVAGTAYTDAAGFYRMLAYSPREGVSRSPDREGDIVVTTTDGAVGSTGRIVIAPGEFQRVEDVIVSEGGTLSGRVLTADGRPAVGAELLVRSNERFRRVLEERRDPSTLNRSVERIVFTDDRGRYELRNLPPGTYRVTSDRGYEGLNTSATIVELSAGQQAFANITLLAENFIRGRVVDRNGTALPGVTVYLESEAKDEGGIRLVTPETDDARLSRRDGGLTRLDDDPQRPSNRMLTDEQGRFGFYRLRDHAWTVVASVGDANVHQQGVTPGGPDVNLTIDRRSLISGTVTDAETGQPVTAFDVRVFVGAQERDADPFVRVAENRGFPFRAEGKFATVVRVSAETFQVRVTAPGYATAVVDVRDFAEGEARTGVDIQLKPLCELHLAIVHDGRRLDLEPVLLLFEQKLVYRGSSSELGVARMADVTPGTYRVLVVQQDGLELRGEVTVPAQRRAELEVELSG